MGDNTKMNYDCTLFVVEGLKKFGEEFRRVYHHYYYHELTHYRIYQFFQIYSTAEIHYDGDTFSGKTHFQTTYKFRVILALVFNYFYDFLEWFYYSMMEKHYLHLHFPEIREIIPLYWRQLIRVIKN